MREGKNLKKKKIISMRPKSMSKTLQLLKGTMKIKETESGNPGKS